MVVSNTRASRLSLAAEVSERNLLPAQVNPPEARRWMPPPSGGRWAVSRGRAAVSLIRWLTQRALPES